MSQLAKLLKKKRIELDYSQDSIASELGCHVMYISNYERDKCYIAYKYLSKLSSILRVSINEIEDAIMIDERNKFRSVLNESTTQNAN